ncbi:MAG: PAS domain-containing protein, partial [Colwellia sp.]|nr:PAS domain-containing protein [Colwellia sp.]
MLKNNFSLLFFQLISILFTTIIIPLPIHASTNVEFEASPLKFNHLTTADGLSQSYVFSIAQDKQGFMWIATEDGLDRYDGKTFVHYRHKPDDEHSLADNFVRKIYIDKNNTIWIGTENGLSRYNRELDNFDNYKNTAGNKNSLKDNLIWSIYQDNFANLWVSTSEGIHKYDPKNNNFVRIRIRGYEKKLKRIRTIFQDKDNNYWFGTYKNGLFILNENLSYAVSLQEKNKWDFNISANAIFDIKIIENDYWLATDNGVYVITENYQLKKHLYRKDEESLILSNFITSIEKFDDTHIWLATKNGLNSINLIDYSIKSYQNTPHSSSLSENWLNTIFKDSTGKIWLGTYAKGISLYDPLSSIFKHTLDRKSQDNFTVESFIENKNVIWLSTDQGKLFNYSSDNIVNINIPGINEAISQFLKDKFDNLWLRTTDNKLYYFNLKENKTTEYPQWYNLSKHPVNSLLILIENNIWYIDLDGILTNFDIEIQTFKQHPLKDGSFLTALNSDNDKINHSDEVLWVTSNNDSLLQFNILKGEFTKFISDKGLRLKETKNLVITPNWIWLGTQSQGITLINRNNDKISFFDESNKLNNNFIADILIDENENAWISTNKGISVIEPNSEKVKNFGRDFSITNNEFLVLSSLHTSNKTMFFGGTNGFYQFDPIEALQISQKIYKPVFTNAYIANKKVSIKNKNKNKNKNFTLQKQVNFLDKVVLTYNQFPFSIAFISPNSKLPNQLQYKYRLKGLNENWIDADLNYLRATYTNLNAGDYTFEVEVYDLYDSAINHSNSIEIEIMPPWWLSKSALAIYGLISLAFIFYILQQVRHKRKYHQQIQESEERLKLSLWGSGDEMWDWNIVTGKIFRSNIWGILEFPQDGTRNVGSDKTNLHQHDIPRVRQALDDHFDRKTDHFESTYRVKDKNDRWIWVLDRGKVV